MFQPGRGACGRSPAEPSHRTAPHNGINGGSVTGCEQSEDRPIGASCPDLALVSWAILNLLTSSHGWLTNTISGQVCLSSSLVNWAILTLLTVYHTQPLTPFWGGPFLPSLFSPPHHETCLSNVWDSNLLVSFGINRNLTDHPNTLELLGRSQNFCNSKCLSICLFVEISPTAKLHTGSF